ncbi:MAG TPA: hypothetical protein VGM63_24705 [Mucilaginibacter sp.]|jgi:hypothetical protein
MKKLFYLLGLVSLALFIYSAVHLTEQFKHGPTVYLGNVKAFDASKDDPEFKAFSDKLRQKIKVFTDQADHDQSLYFWMSFLVTGLTAASTLVSSIQAAKKDTVPPPDTKVFAIVVAILTFASTLSNFASTHFNELKSEDVKKATALTTLRDQFFTDYDKTPTDGKHAVIALYERKLD